MEKIRANGTGRVASLLFTARSTAARSLPAFSIAYAERSFVTVDSGSRASSLVWMPEKISFHEVAEQAVDKVGSSGISVAG
jgi:hypothetical protein